MNTNEALALVLGVLVLQAVLVLAFFWEEWLDAYWLAWLVFLSP